MERKKGPRIKKVVIRMQCCRWRKVNNLPYKHTIVAYSTAMAGICSRIGYGNCQKKSATPFHLGSAM